MIKVLWLVPFLAFIGAGMARADVSAQWNDCKTEIGKFCKSASDDSSVFKCIEKREHMGKKKSGLSHACYEAHEAYEKSAGKTDADEHSEHKT